MNEVHLPQLEDHEDAPPVGRPHGNSVWKIMLEVLLISTGVFLGLAGEQWRENVHRKDLAVQALERFRTEIVTNQKMVLNVKDYHVTVSRDIEAYLSAATPEAKKNVSLHIKGLQPVAFEHTAWDVALATQALEYLDPALVFDLSRIYNGQQGYLDLSHGILQAMYIDPPGENRDKFLRAVALYYGDITLMERDLLKSYEEILPKIEQSLAR